MADLQLYSVSKRFGKKVILNDVSFKCSTGDVLAIFGKNGCGKSTLLKLLYGTIKANAIDMSINGKKAKPSEVIEKKQIAYLPQHSFLPKTVLVRDIIPMYFSSQEKQDQIFYDTLTSTIAAKKVGALSIGQLRYFQVLLISHLDAPFLLFDEPYSMIDPKYKDIISQRLTQIKHKKGIIITDHYYEDVLNISTKNLLLKDGKSHLITSKEDLVKLFYLPKHTSK